MQIQSAANYASSALQKPPERSTETAVSAEKTEVNADQQKKDQLAVEKSAQQAKPVSEDVVNSRVAEHQVSATNHQVSADEAVGSLINVEV